MPQDFRILCHTTQVRGWSLTFEDQILITLLKILPVLTSMIDLSFETAHFADAWKETLLLPVLKKSGLEVA